jgi:Holliday junction DNA helicase RuvA
VIARLEGVLHAKTPTRVEIDVHGVGYEVFIPFSTFTALPDEGKTVALRIHTHAREGALQLFGFATSVERTAFELLLRASRVGPKLAQTVLSGIDPVSLLEAIRAGNAAPLRAVPGVGAKLADRILVELSDRADELEAAVRASGALPSSAGAGRATPEGRDQALSALLNLGYPRPHAERALADVDAEVAPDADVEPWVRAALKRLAR